MEADISVAAGDYFYIPMHCKYQSYWYGEPGIAFDSYGFIYFPESSGRPMPLQLISANEKIRRLHESIPTDGKITCESVGKFYQFLGELLPLMKTRELPSEQDALEDAVRQMHLQPNLRVPELARLCGMSESGLYSAF